MVWKVVAAVVAGEATGGSLERRGRGFGGRSDERWSRWWSRWRQWSFERSRRWRSGSEGFGKGEPDAALGAAAVTEALRAAAVPTRGNLCGVTGQRRCSCHAQQHFRCGGVQSEAHYSRAVTCGGQTAGQEVEHHVWDPFRSKVRLFHVICSLRVVGACSSGLARLMLCVCVFLPYYFCLFLGNVFVSRSAYR
jgi:hypothetical protein